MGVWVAAADLEPGEMVVHRSFANVLKGARAIGGQVTVTDRRVLFIPNRLDALTGGTRVEITRQDITATRIGAGVRVQVEIDYPAGTLALTVRDVVALSSALEQ